MNIVIFSFEKLSLDWKLYNLTFGMVLGSVLFPTWFFQGMEKMKYITILTIIAKIIFTVAIFIFVQSSEDYLFVPFLNSLGFIIAGLISLYIVLKDFNISIKWQKFQHVKIQLIRGKLIFLSKISISFYSTSNVFILGLFTNSTVVGYYIIAEKVIIIINSLFTPFYQAIYPHVARLVKESKDKAGFFLQKVLKTTIVFSLLAWLIIFIFSSPLFHLAFGDDINHTIELFRVLSPFIIIRPVAYLLFNVVLLSYRLDQYFLKIYFFGGVLNLSFVFIFLQLFDLNAFGISVALLLSEFIITAIAAKIIYDKKIIFKKIKIKR